MTITKVVLAKLSPTMEEGTIVKWSKKEGDPVKVGDVLAEIETDKANMEMEALGAGVLRKVLVGAGGKAPVGALIGVIAEPSEDIAAVLAGAGPAAAPAPPPARPAAQAASKTPATAPTAAPAATARPPAPPDKVPPAHANATQAPAATPAPAPAAAPLPPAPAAEAARAAAPAP